MNRSDRIILAQAILVGALTIAVLSLVRVMFGFWAWAVGVVVIAAVVGLRSRRW